MHLLAGNCGVLKEVVEQDVKWFEDKFDAGAKFESKKSNNYIQFVEPKPNRDPSTLSEFIGCIYCIGTKAEERSRAKEHDREFKQSL
jgi:hypothetical protein